MSEPETNLPSPPLRAAVFIDGQNLFRSVKETFGYYYPNFCPYKLAMWAVTENEWSPCGVHFYTGIPDFKDDQFWNQTWGNMFSAWGRRGVKVYQRPIRYHYEKVKFNDGTIEVNKVPREKGIDVKIALDLVMQAMNQKYDAAIIFSQDNDLAVAVDEVAEIAKQQGRVIPIISAFPKDAPRPYGITGTKFLKFDKSSYDKCIDPKDYRPRRSR